MAISKDEIDKYIFDPENPKQCLVYKALLNMLKRDNGIFISTDFLIEFFLLDSFIEKIKDELWDIPTNYEELSKKEKVNLYIKQLSKNDFIDLLNNNIDCIANYSLNGFNKSVINLEVYPFNKTIIEEVQDKFLSLSSKKIKKELKKKKLEFFELEMKEKKNIITLFDCLLEDKLKYDVIEFNHLDEKNKIIFYNFDGLNFLNFNFFKKSNILITTLEKWNKEYIYFQSRWLNMSNNINPLLLKKIEDVEILLNVLEQDLKKEKKIELVQENISTIDKINIENFFSIKDIKLNNLKEKKEVYIVGENGDGKSLFLQAIAIALAGVKEGDVFDLVKSQSDYKLAVLDSDKKEYTQNSEQAYNYILAYGASRNNYCQMKEDETGYLTLFKGEYDLKSPIKWLQYLDYSEKSNKENILTVDEAKELLQHLLNSDIQIDISADKVIFTEKGSEVSFDQLSAGYKGVITIICDLIARLSEKQEVESIADFQGVVLIDEIELHLHPKWQYGFMNKLRSTFPLIQFIVTTHSPTVLLGAGMEAVYYQIYKEEGVVKISEQKGVKNDFLNDIQSDIFGFDVNDERINNPSEDDKKRQKRAKENLLNLIKTVKEEK